VKQAIVVAMAIVVAAVILAMTLGSKHHPAPTEDQKFMCVQVAGGNLVWSDANNDCYCQDGAGT